MPISPAPPRGIMRISLVEGEMSDDEWFIKGVRSDWVFVFLFLC
jgi:hypothetical protein